MYKKNRDDVKRDGTDKHDFDTEPDLTIEDVHVQVVDNVIDETSEVGSDKTRNNKPHTHDSFLSASPALPEDRSNPKLLTRVSSEDNKKLIEALKAKNYSPAGSASVLYSQRDSDMSPSKSAKRVLFPHEDKKITTSFSKLGKEEWRKIELDKFEHVPNLHEHWLKFYDVQQDVQEDDDGTWRCNGVDFFDNGCKSGQKEFESYKNTLAWQSTGTYVDEDGVEQYCDFDLCEMCLRWALYCEKKGEGNKKLTLELFQRDDERSITAAVEKSSLLTKLPLVGASTSQTNFSWPSLDQL